MEERLSNIEHAIGILLREKLSRFNDGVSFSDKVLQSFVDKVKDNE